MRRWEFVEGGSDKFWEAAVDGVVVTVRYGRSGTDGREQSKEFPTAEAAQAHFAKTVAEKERKGYREATAGAAPAPQPAAATPSADSTVLPDAPLDEDTFVLPDAWRRILIPRRGGVARATTAPTRNAPEKLRALVAEQAEWVEQALASSQSDADLVEVARAHLGGAGDPRGAAVVAALVADSPEGYRRAVDGWVVEHGLPFAARAVVELLEVTVTADSSNARRFNPRVGVAKRRHRASVVHRAAADRVRALLAVCDEETHAAVVESLADCRKDLPRLVVAVYLVPSETAWAEECLRGSAGLDTAAWSLLLCSLSSAEPLMELDRLPGLGWDGWSADVVATVAEGLGGGAAPLLLHALVDDYLYSDRRKQL
ncbi:WGR domain-containing protein, partial [Kitasatospora paracochleata]|uniref:WGR domain-containing protein n=1 Tax=Kitasatospora paracochleata TaxID=58354 RepID=UPI0031D7DFB1